MHFVYLLKSEVCTRTYVGYSNDPVKRLRKHNGELVGGAKYTRGWRPWKIIAIVCGFINKNDALRFEWRAQHSRKCGKWIGYDLARKRCWYGPNGRLRLIRLLMEKWDCEGDLKMYCVEDMRLDGEELLCNFTHVSELKK